MNHEPVRGTEGERAIALHDALSEYRMLARLGDLTREERARKAHLETLVRDLECALDRPSTSDDGWGDASDHVEGYDE